ncbi:hypothetical protein SAMN05216241_107147 [Limimonas halophila]|uniref:DUF4139 domain-containing protein n=2 Tax=Limimonas halophila TaxID=1082479 RepID=A0A1G7SUB5_9PROT|nr:hypothetical protein [Limimonas halophila]SDG26374.1 hypothetical protein SAMN05216241_107147 [Limimonas halophila]
MRLPAFLTAAFVAAAPALAADTTRTLTVYPDDLARMSVERQTRLPEGASSLRLNDLSPGIVADSLTLRGEGVRVLEQQVSPWPITRQQLLQAHLGETVHLIRPNPTGRGRETVEAELLALADGPVLSVQDRVLHDPRGEIVFPDLPKDAATLPRATLRVQADGAGERTLTTSYLTKGLSWKAAHSAQWDPAAGTLTLRTMAAVESRLNTAIEADSLQLVAGAVAQAEQPRPQREQATTMRAMSAADAGKPSSAANLKVYELDRGLSLDAGGRTQLALMTPQTVDVQARYRVTNLATAEPQPDTAQAPVDLRLRVADTREAGLDRALPAGVVRVNAGGVFRGEQRVADTPLGTELTLDLGNAFDVTARAKQTGYRRIGEDAYQLSRQVTLSNAREKPVTVRVIGRFPRDWRMLEESHQHLRETAQRPVWAVEVPAGGESTLRYTVRVSER